MTQEVYFISLIAAFSTFLLIVVLADLLVLYRLKRKSWQNETELLLDKKEREKSEAIEFERERERESISQELHDGITGSLCTIKNYLEAIKLEANELNGVLRGCVQKAEIEVETTLNEVRHVSHQLSTGILADFGLVSALQDLKETLASTRRITFNFSSGIEHKRYHSQIEINLYRIIQELTRNTIKHSGAKKIELAIYEEGRSLNVNYTDNGKGFNQKSQKTGLGLRNINNRIEMLNGEFKLLHQNKGFQATISIPIEGFYEHS